MSGINSLTEFNHALEMLDKLDTVLENINNELNWLTITEGADEGNPEQEAANEKKKGELGKLARKTVDEFIKTMKALVDTIIAKISTFIRGGDSAVAKEDFYGDNIINNKRFPKLSDTEADIEQLLNVGNVKYEAGKPIDLKTIYANLNECKKSLRAYESFPLNDPEKADSFNAHKAYLKKYITASTQVIKKAIPKKVYLAKYKNEYSKMVKDDEKQKKKDAFVKEQVDKAKNANAEKAEVLNNSIDFDGMTRNEFIANLMLEAADLLKDDVQKDDSDFKEFDEIPEEKPVTTDDYDPEVNGGEGEKVDNEETKDLVDGNKTAMDLLTNDENKSVTVDALKEAVDLLYEKAVMCEDASEAETYIQKAEELQKAIQDIPEEKPVKTDDYDPDVNGGEGEKIDLEEIKDLCDGDEEVIKLLTDDEDKSVTVNADGSNNESALSFFDIDF